MVGSMSRVHGFWLTPIQGACIVHQDFLVADGALLHLRKEMLGVDMGQLKLVVGALVHTRLAQKAEGS